MVLKEIGIGTRNWVDSFQDRDYWRARVDATLNVRVPKAMELVMYTVPVNFVISSTRSFARRTLFENNKRTIKILFGFNCLLVFNKSDKKLRKQEELQ